ncbi:MAG: ATP-binding cassette domain-containing protein [Mariprofundaceae bacterium]|nr:ATP-binding cassette domain-containing protein [Mariprofundaceae bacterium]
MIQADKLSRLYGEKYAVRDLSFHVRHGEVMGLLGPNGAGKSTTMKMLTCFLPPSSGTASMDGIDIQQDLHVRRRVGYLPEHAPSYSDLNVHGHLSFMGRMYGIPEATLNDKIREMSAACGLEGRLHQRIDELSKGYRQRVGLAASMLHNPDCLILDEPTTGLDPNQMVEIRQLIRHLGEKKTVLLSSHVLSEVDAVCDRMMIIDGGELRALGTRDELIALSSSGLVLDVCMRGDADAVVTAICKQYDGCEVDMHTVEESGLTKLTFRHVDDSIPLAESVFSAVVAVGGVLLEMHAQETSLEDVFHRLTGGTS